MNSITPLFDGATGPGWRAQHPQLFRTDASLRWFFRHHKHRLIASGAVVLLRDAWMAVEPRMSEAVLIIAAERAKLVIESEMSERSPSVPLSGRTIGPVESELKQCKEARPAERGDDLQ